MDYSATSLELSGKTNAEALQQGKMDLVEASVEKLPFADNAFDKIITVESFYFWPNPAENLKEVYRVLKEQGTFLLVADIYQKEDLPEQVRETFKDSICLIPHRKNSGNCWKMQDLKRYGFA